MTVCLYVQVVFFLCNYDSTKTYTKLKTKLTITRHQNILCVSGKGKKKKIQLIISLKKGLDELRA